MSHDYKAVGWNGGKRRYDFAIFIGVLLAVSATAAVTALVHPLTTAETFLIRFLAVTAFTLLHIILLIGPLARLDRRFLALLYNRRHLGVTMALFALLHAALATFQFHAVGDANPLVSVFTAYGQEYAAPFGNFRDISQFPFEIFGFCALVILLLMAATSHDFWLRVLGPSVWKTLHQGVYVAYGLLLAHVLFGVIQAERSLFYPLLMGAGFVAVIGTHLMAAAKERSVDQAKARAAEDGFEPVVPVHLLREGEGRVVVVAGERLALFVQNSRIYALSNVCRHQGGPIGEGKIVSGCITCPWHGFQYRAEDGCSPPPFTEILPTYPVRVIGGTVHVSPVRLPDGTKSEGVDVEIPAETAAGDAPFFIGWQSAMAEPLRRFVKAAIAALAVFVPAVFGLVTWLQHPVDRGLFEFGVEKEFEGVLYESPVPRLRVKLPDGKYQDHILVGSGKFGPPPNIDGHHGEQVRFRGSLIVREPLRMIEMNRPETFTSLGKPGADSDPVASVSLLGEGRFLGELVDTKCFSGVMRPATGKVHRACAVRCLSGGIPPGLLVRDARGDGVALLLAGADDATPLRFDARLAGSLIAVDGRLELHGNTPVLRVKSFVEQR
jgi:nitrite reductase/ring-hydroxylating ferredoxin subunit/DMSO/TMAO reductase YedYZ heme-binding membrane subunit